MLQFHASVQCPSDARIQVEWHNDVHDEEQDDGEEDDNENEQDDETFRLPKLDLNITNRILWTSRSCENQISDAQEEEENFQNFLDMIDPPILTERNMEDEQ